MFFALAPVAEVEIHFGERTGRIVIVALLVVPFAIFVWSSRDRMVRNEFRRLQRVVGLADAGGDHPLLVQRLRQRQSGRAVGIIAAALVVGVALVWADPVLPWVVLATPFGAAVGTIVGQLRPLAVPGGPRLAQLRRRELGDYLTPLELRLLKLAFAAVPAALVLLVVAAIRGEPSVGLVTGGCVMLAGVAIAAGLIRAATARVLQSSVGLGSLAGLEWEEVIRAQTLRDVVGAAACLTAGGTAGVLWWLSSADGFPRWFVTCALVLGGFALAMLVVFVVVASLDSRFTWARSHALAGLDV